MTHKDQKLTGDNTAEDLSASTPLHGGADATDSTANGAAADTGTTPVTEVILTDDRDHSPSQRAVNSSIAGSTWVGLVIGAIILILLLVFILQNGETVQLKMFIWTWDFPIGVGMLIAAVAGALIAACIGTVRIIQLRRQVKTGQ